MCGALCRQITVASSSLARVYDLGVMKRFLPDTVEPAVHDLDPLREGMILIGDFVLPGAETTSAEDIPFLESREQFLKSEVAAERRCWVAALESSVPGVMNLLSTLDEARRDETPDRVLDDASRIDRLHG